MTFDEFLNQAWTDHATQSAQVATRIHEGIKLIHDGGQIAQLAHLVTHVFGEHLGQWTEGVQVLEELKDSTAYEPGRESEKAVVRSIAGLRLAGGQKISLAEFSLSDQIRILSVAAAALSGRNQTARAQILFQQAVEKAQSGLPKEDPANRALAVTGNNLAATLEEIADRDSSQTELMIFAARAGRKYWEIAGTWLEVERAEYRLARTFLRAGDFTRALEHAQTCLEIVEKNKAAPLECFFGYEALALVEKARDNSIDFAKAKAEAAKYFGQLGAGDQAWCKASLQSLK